MYLYQDQKRYDLLVGDVDRQQQTPQPIAKRTEKQQPVIQKPKKTSVSLSKKKQCGTNTQTNMMEFVLYILIIMMVVYILYEGMIKTQNK